MEYGSPPDIWVTIGMSAIYRKSFRKDFATLLAKESSDIRSREVTRLNGIEISDTAVIEQYLISRKVQVEQNQRLNFRI